MLYFYPRDDTPGLHAGGPGVHRSPGRIRGRRCGDRRCLQGHYRQARQVQCEKYGLPFTLVSDAEGDICERYGVWVEKKNYGKTYMGIERSTFLINADGTVSKVWRKVKVAGHVDAVLGAVKDLNSGDG